jgi:hypothetical protein
LKLVSQIEHYNQIVKEIDTLATLASLTKDRDDRADTASILDILLKTRQNLLVALQIESHAERLRHQPNSTQLTLAIANNLIDLQTLARQPQLVEYETLLSQAWEIGMSVYRETME